MRDFGDERLKRMIEFRPKFKSKAVVTAGMPYGNKLMHFGHVSTMLHADFMARFLRDRIGKNNVVFVSGTDCYGSPIMESYRKLVESGKTTLTMEEWVKHNHLEQFETTKKYNLSYNFYGASAVGDAKPIHEELSAEIFNKLYTNNALSKLETLQFYDEKKKTFLNGRQVIGKCPFENCQSEKAYADECDLGHQYMPKDLINPISSLSGTTPTLKAIGNWYFNLNDNVDLLKDWLAYLEKNTSTRSYAIKEMREFLKKPEIYIKQEYKEKVLSIATLPKYELIDDNKNSFTIIFEKLSDREQACEILNDNNIRFRTGKTLVPFRLSGNISWGVPVPDKDGYKDLTFWVWPESLWAPISFTKTYLKKIGKDDSEWKKYWCGTDTSIYQFIGEDNIYFYGPAQNAIWLNLQDHKPSIEIGKNDLAITTMVANKHSLFLGKKASSSSEIKPPMANDLLNYYTPDQLRFHMLAMNVGNNNASFMAKPFNPDAKPEDIDPVTKEYTLLTNVYNRALRTLFYTWQKEFDGYMPYGEVEESFIKEATLTILKIEKLMYEQKFHMVIYEYDTYIRNLNKYLSKEIKEVTNDEERLSVKQALINGLYMAKVAMVLLHPIAPLDTENLAKAFGVSEDIFSWETIDEPIYKFIENPEHHKPMFLEPRQDFFKTSLN